MKRYEILLSLAQMGSLQASAAAYGAAPSMPETQAPGLPAPGSRENAVATIRPQPSRSNGAQQPPVPSPLAVGTGWRKFATSANKEVTPTTKPVVSAGGYSLTRVAPPITTRPSSEGQKASE